MQKNSNLSKLSLYGLYFRKDEYIKIGDIVDILTKSDDLIKRTDQSWSLKSIFECINQVASTSGNILTSKGVCMKPCRLVRGERMGNDIITDIINLQIDMSRESDNCLSKEQENILRNDMQRYFCQYLGKDCFAVLAMDNDNNAVSCAILNVFTQVPTQNIPNGRYGEIYGVYTKKEFRNNGFATAVINELLIEASHLNVSFIKLCPSGNETSIYQRCGFEQTDNNTMTMKYC